MQQVDKTEVSEMQKVFFSLIQKEQTDRMLL